MPSTQNSESSVSSLDSFRSRSESTQKRALVESYLLSPACTLALEDFFAEDEDALALMAIFRCAEGFSFTFPIERESDFRRLIYNQNVIKGHTTDLLIKKGIERAFALPTFPKDDGYRPLDLPPPAILSASPEPEQSLPTSPISQNHYNTSDEETPQPVPSSQLAVRSTSRP